MKCFVTGAAGFIGSNLVDRLLADGHTVVGYDNLSTGFIEFLADAKKSAYFELIQGDTLDASCLSSAMSGSDMVFHLAANADIRFGASDPSRDLNQNAIATFNVLEAMRVNQIKRIVFSSTSAVYGDTAVVPTPENTPLPVQTSLYGASKIASEGLVTAYCGSYDFQCYIFRFVSIVGERYSHGHIFDFYKKLLHDNKSLEVLGDGQQKKSYLYVHDCIDAILTAISQLDARINIFNLGSSEYCQVNDSIGWICEALNLSPKLDYQGGKRGWVGDNPFVFLDASAMRLLGWSPEISLRQGILRTLSYLRENQWLIDQRS